MIAIPVVTDHILAKQRAQRADLPITVIIPVQPVMLARFAENLLRVFQRTIAVAVLCGVVHLRIVVSQHRLQGAQLVAADAPGADFGAAGLEVEAPALAAFAQRYGQRPVLTAHRQYGLALRCHVDAVLCTVLFEEGVHVAALHTAARDVGAPVIAQQLGQAGFIRFLLAQRRDEGLHGLLRRREGFLRSGQG
ncbi:hypothetical protein D3C81_1620190 [compost metagenome]